MSGAVQGIKMVFTLQTLESAFKEEVVGRGKWTTRIKVHSEATPRAPEIATQRPPALGSRRQTSKRYLEEEEIPWSGHALEGRVMLPAPKLWTATGNVAACREELVYISASVQ